MYFGDVNICIYNGCINIQCMFCCECGYSHPVCSQTVNNNFSGICNECIYIQCILDAVNVGLYNQYVLNAVDVGVCDECTDTQSMLTVLDVGIYTQCTVVVIKIGIYIESSVCFCHKWGPVSTLRVIMKPCLLAFIMNVLASSVCLMQ